MSIFAVALFPLVDLRPFLGAETGRNPSPTWPVVYFPDEKHRFPFIRGFGQVRARPRGGLAEWSAEETFCDVSHALRFNHAFLTENPARRAGELRTYCAFRRLYWDGRFTPRGSVIGRVEVGFALRAARGRGLRFSQKDVEDIVTSLLGHRCYLLSKRSKAPETAASDFELLFAGNRLGQAYLNATTSARQSPLAKPNPWWIGSGSPLILLECDNTWHLEPPAGSLRVDADALRQEGIETFLHRHPVQGLMRPVWIVRHDHANVDVLRRLRINFSRLHSEVAGLKWVTNVVLKGQLKPPPRSQADEDFQRYLRDTLPYLTQESFNGLPNFALLHAALGLLGAPTPGELDTLRRVVENIRPGIRAQLARLGTKFETVQEWDFFIAHAGADKAHAEDLYSRLAPAARTFLDSKSLIPGDDWDLQLARAQRTALMTVVLVSSSTEQAYYEREEIAAAIQMARDNPETHRVVPVYVHDEAGARPEIPYGLRLKHALELTGQDGMRDVTTSLLAALSNLRSRRTANPTAH